MKLSRTLFALLGLAARGSGTSENKKPHLVFILQDDLGRFDVGFNNPNVSEYSGNITEIASQGIKLTSHYVHWHCSPTRRSFLTGRLPVHHGELLSGLSTDDIDLRWNILSQKLKTAGYTNYWFGKGHTGYKSWKHMPSNRGFDAFYGFLGGAGSYTKLERFNDTTPDDTDHEYSTDLFGETTLSHVRAHDPSKPMFLYLPWQAVHEPYDAPPVCSVDPKACPNILLAMLREADEYVGSLISLLKEKSMWKDTLLVYSADNGGVTAGNNYPLRGEKHTSWEGGMRVAAFVSGGLVPENLRGTTSDERLHIVDWYPTFCKMAGVDPTDDSPVPPLPIDPSKPDQDIYGNNSWPGVDGIDAWPLLTQQVPTAAKRRRLVLSRECLLDGDLKIMVAQPSPKTMSANSLHNGWRLPNGTWTTSDDTEYGCNAYKNRTKFRPCLFNVTGDISERQNLADQMEDQLQKMWADLNNTFLGAYHSRTPEDMLGACNTKCSKEYFKNLGGTGQGPICGVPGCK